MRTRVKMCGFTRVEDAVFAANLGVDAIGLVFYPKSPRAVDTGRARDLAAALPPFVSVVGLFVDPNEDEVRRVLDAVPLDMLQFHGNEADEFCRRFNKPWLKAIGVQSSRQLLDCAQRYPHAKGLLLDRFDDKLHGGTGQTFDWTMIPASGLDKPLILAGGLKADTVAAAVAAVKPYGVDVSSGIEVAKGRKEREKMKAFMQAVLDSGVAS